MVRALLFWSFVKTTSLVGLVMVAAMNLVACPGLDGIGGCSADDPEVNMHVAPLTFETTTSSETCDADGGVVLQLNDAQGSSIRITVQQGVRLGTSLPLTADTEASGSAVTSMSADGAVEVRLMDAEYNELPGGLQSAALTVYAMPIKAGQSLSGDLHFYFVDGRTLDVLFDKALAIACAVPQSI